MTYDTEILRILTLAGKKGLKAEKIARHVFNSCNSMFSPLDYKEVHMSVLQYLTKNAKSPSSLLKKGEGYGVYRLNLKSPKAKELLLEFAPHDEKQQKEENGEKETSNQPQYPSLFD